MGEFGSGSLLPEEEEWEKDRSFARDQTWILESPEPDKIKFELGSTARQVVG